MNHSHLFKLVNREPVEIDSEDTEGLINWSKNLGKGKNIIEKTKISDQVLVSTVFLGVAHGNGEDGKPLLFETMIFNDGHSSECYRACTWEDAEKMHQRVIARLTF